MALFGRNTGAQSHWSFASGIGSILVVLGAFVPGAGAASSPPGPPTVTGVTAGPSAVTVTFDAPADDGGSPIDSYLATCSSSDAGVGNSGTTTTAAPVLVTGLTPGKTYTCVVAATSVAGQGADSAPSGVFVPLATVPGTPSIASIVAGNGNAAVTVNPPADDGGAPITAVRRVLYVDRLRRRRERDESDHTRVGRGAHEQRVVHLHGDGHEQRRVRARRRQRGDPFVIPPAPVTGAISGTVTTNPPAMLNGYCAEATETWNNQSLGSAAIAADGTYTLTALADHDYAVRFVDCTGGGDYLPRWYGGGLVTPNHNPDGGRRDHGERGQRCNDERHRRCVVASART